MKPYSILFKKEAGGSTIDTQTKWGIVCKDFPFQLYGDTKELPSRSWYDENGDDEYVPKKLYIGAYEIDVEFAYKGNMYSANAAIRSFLDYLTGNDGLNQGALLSVYDTYTKIGRQHIRYVSVENTMTVRNESEGDVFTFTVKFKVNDPITNITL